MDRSLTNETTSSLPLASRDIWLSRLAPLGRYAVFLLSVFGVAAAGAVIRLDVQQLRKDDHRTSRAILEAQILNDRLQLEMETRRRGAAMEHTAKQLGLKPARFVRPRP